ncbi:MAG: TldD/PmbA family protein [Nitrospinaceae bacterium]|nr:MAG: TldD/PmbA family protein [Nitrospinaceae bacterium]
MRSSQFLKVTVLVFCFFVRPAAAETVDEASAIIFKAMEEEMARSREALKVDVFEPPYFIHYQVRHHHRVSVLASFGSLIDSSKGENRTLFVDVRVGDKSFDSSVPGSHQYGTQQMVPLDNDYDALRRALWQETDLRYKQAIMNYLKKKGRYISGVEAHDIDDFSAGDPVGVRIEEVPEIGVDVDLWEEQARQISAVFKQAPEIEKSRVKLNADRIIRHYMDSDGNKIRSTILRYGVSLEAWTKTESGAPIHDQETITLSGLKQFPSVEELTGKADRLIRGLKELKKAARAEPYVGPAIFSPDASAILFHEAIGHRLEADRLRQATDGKTFMKKVGKRILPPFLTVVDNPLLKNYNETDLAGHYLFDDEGQKSQKVVLIDQGVLKSFLLSRTPVSGFSRSNGHARSDGTKLPMSRMGNILVQSDKRLSPDALKQSLIDEVKRQKKPYGLFVKKILSGETQTEAANFQVFKGKPIYIYKVYPDGREELVRGVEFVGTPLSMISKVIATGRDDRVINGFCGAESGFIPVTSVTPSVLLSEVELQAASQTRLRPPILTPPPL